MNAKHTGARYGRQVFERLIGISGLGLEFFDLRDDGAWLTVEASSDELNWTPACDLEGPASPDPLSTPAIAFPFSGSHLAAWMLDGWGFFLGQAVGGFDPIAVVDQQQTDTPGIDSVVLDGLGVQAVKVREALEEAHRAFREAVAHVGTPDADLPLSESRAADAQSVARATAARAQNWREQGIPSEEAERRRLAYLSAIEASRGTHAAASSAAKEDYRAWRKRMVRALFAEDLNDKFGADTGSKPKLDHLKDLTIAEKFAAGKSVSSLAKEYGVSRRLIDQSLVRTGRKTEPRRRAKPRGRL